MPFASFEWMLAWRYLGARRKEGFVSVIAGFSLAGIALGVAILIIVMAVMNGFKSELLSRLLGLTGHVLVQEFDHPMTDYDALAARLRHVPGLIKAAPLIEGEVLVNAKGQSGG